MVVVSDETAIGGRTSPERKVRAKDRAFHSKIYRHGVTLVCQ